MYRNPDMTLIGSLARSAVQPDYVFRASEIPRQIEAAGARRRIWKVFHAIVRGTEPYAEFAFVRINCSPVSAIPFSGRAGMCGSGQSKQQANGNKSFHRAPFCCEFNLSDAHEQYNLG